MRFIFFSGTREAEKGSRDKARFWKAAPGCLDQRRSFSNRAAAERHPSKDETAGR
jgi:hypothetical protein